MDAAHGPGGYAAAALFLGGEEQQHGHLKLEECTARASTSKIVMARAQYAMRDSCLWTFWFLCGQFLLVCVAMSRGFCVAMLGAKFGPRNQRARKPPAAPQSRSPRRTELSRRVRNVSVRVQARVRVVGLHGGWQPQKERRGVFFWRLKSRRVEPP